MALGLINKTRFITHLHVCRFLNSSLNATVGKVPDLAELSDGRLISANRFFRTVPLPKQLSDSFASLRHNVLIKTLFVCVLIKR